MYEAALADGGNLVVYTGGDTPQQQDDAKAAFLQRFPKINLKIVIDYSKYHDARLDNQFATNSVVPDYVELQTLQDFTRWKKAGRLEPFKPEGFDFIHDIFKDPDGAWLATSVLAFSFMYDAAGVAGKVLLSPRDLVKPEWRGHIASSYPHDDDAVLFLYRLYTEAYGWDWVRELAAQDIQFARGTHTPELALVEHRKLIGIGGAGSMAPNGPVRWVVADDHPFLAWGQRAAVLKGAKNLNAAKLYMSWQISMANQATSFNGWSVRTDVQPEGGPKPIWAYANSNLDRFPEFMSDRAHKCLRCTSAK